MNAAFPARQRPLRELDVVRLLGQHTGAQGTLHVGDTGTIVHRYRGGEAFEFEFLSPTQAVATLGADEIAHTGV